MKTIEEVVEFINKTIEKNKQLEQLGHTEYFVVRTINFNLKKVLDFINEKEFKNEED